MIQFWIPEEKKYDNTLAALRNLRHHLQLDVTWEDVARILKSHPSYPAISIQDLVAVINEMGAEAVAIELDTAKLRTLALPCLAFCKDSRSPYLVVLLNVSDKAITFIHTKKGVVETSHADFLTQWIGLAILVKRNHPPTNKTIERDKQERNVRIQQLKREGFLNVIDEFLSDRECGHIIDLAKPLFSDSKITGSDKVEESSHRTSKSAFLTKSDDVLTSVRRRISKQLDNLPLDCIEPLQCVEYQHKTFYDYHFDTVSTEQHTDDERMLETCGYRLYTVLIYLNDEFKGGQTYFPSIDFRVTPRKGRALVFQNLDGNEKLLSFSYHAGLPVEEGIKYASNVWVRTKKAQI